MTEANRQDSPDYQRKKAFFDSLITIYGRKPVLEALNDKALPVHKLHLADSNKRDGLVNEMIGLAEQRGIEIAWHDRKALSRISKNGKQDQGVAADLQPQRYRPLEALLETGKDFQLLALDGVLNPQNLGMIIRSVAASPMTGLLLPKRGCAALTPLVIKASAGTLFKAPIYWCENLQDGLSALIDSGAICAALSSHAEQDIYQQAAASKQVYVLGNETEGISASTAKRCQQRLKIPMANGVESLNVAVTAALIAFAPLKHSLKHQ